MKSGKGKAGRPKGNKNKTPQKPKVPGEPKKRLNFTKLENENICKAWKSVSQHPVIGTNQMVPNVWAKVKEVFDLLMLEFLDKEIMVPQTQQAILDRFQRLISHLTTKFNACYIIQKQMNEKNGGKPFPFKHCL